MIDLAAYTPTPLEGLVALFLLLACVTDLRGRLIPNSLTFPLWGIGVAWHVLAWLLGTGEWWVGLLGLAVTFPIHFALFALGIDKGGDAKLMIGVGACLGWWMGVEATLWGILLMLPVAIVVAAATGKMNSLWRTMVWVVKMPFFRAIRLHPGPPPPQTYVPKAPVIALAVVVARFTLWGEAWLLSDAMRASMGAG